MNSIVDTIRWSGEIDGDLVLLDQTRLPREIVYLECRRVEDVWDTIKRLSVRGAPAIGIAAAFGVCLGVRQGWSVDEVCSYLATSRPTAVNLFWALERMRRVAGVEVEPCPQRTTAAGSRAPSGSDGLLAPQHPTATFAKRLLAEARAIHVEDRQQCAAMGRHGADLLANLPDGAGFLTHCNTGALATGGDGTALAVIFELARRGKRPHVWVDETRPLLQGARLTMWELQRRNIDATLLCDSAAAQVMREDRVQAVITGADRIAANGDTANKIGTLSVATLAKAFGIPFYVAAPTTTFDLSIPTGRAIPIEERAAEEVTEGFAMRTAPEGVAVYNPAFDVTPAELIATIITDRGNIQPVNDNEIKAMIGRPQVEPSSSVRK